MSRFAEAQSYTASCMERMKSRPEPVGQKFPVGTRVKIADDLGKSMGHFPSGDATVKYTFAHAFGGNDVTSYCLDIDGIGEVSWYYEHQLTEIMDE